MPIFEFKCEDCGKTFEILQLNGKDNEAKCPGCGGLNLKKLISAPFLPSSVGKPANDDLKPCCGSDSKSQGCTPGSCCSGQPN